jgi:hypothetical protein
MDERNVFYVGGKRVKLRDRIPLKTAPHLPKLLRAVEDDYNAIARLGVLLVEEWEFEGDPGDLRAWQELDLLSEIPVFAIEIGKNLSQRQEAAGVPKS